MQSIFSNRGNHVRNQAGTQNVTGDVITGDVHHYYADPQRDGRLQEEAQQKILASLYHPQMDTRRRQIDDRPACEGTFEWILQGILDRSEAQEHAWNSFVHWLQSSNTSTPYWISGKPGSGKSTLMRFLEKRIVQLMNNDSRGDSWTNDASVLLISHYFWASGTDDQKSVISLLQYLLYRLLDARHDLIVTVVSRERYRTASHSSSSGSAWTYHELRDAIVMFVQQCGPSDKIFVHVDGLDEHEGDDEGRWELLKFFGTLASSGQVKVCLSSRPWTVYEDWFKDHPRIRLEDLTANDIEVFVHSRLETDTHISRLAYRDPILINRLTRRILEAAQGVFLWVHLAIRDLKDCARDGGDANELSRLLADIPRDMDKYLRRIMHSIPHGYRREASIMLQVALAEMKNDILPGQNNAHSFRYDWKIEGPSLVDFTYLDSISLPEFATQSHFVPSCRLKVNMNTNGESDCFLLDEEDIFRLDNAGRRISSRCLGLLEVVGAKQIDKQVVFLHRTVRDFLMQKEQEDLLVSFSGTRYDARLFRCNTMLAELKSAALRRASVDSWYTFMYESTIPLITFLHQTMIETTTLPSYQRLFEQLIEIISLEHRAGSYRASYDSMMDPCQLCGYVIMEQLIWDDSPLSVAIRIGWHAYVEAYLLKNGLGNSALGQRPLLDYALRPCVSYPVDPNSAMVRQLLGFGAHPDETYEGVSIWTSFMISLVLLLHGHESPLESMPEILDTLEILLRSGTKAYCKGREIILAMSAIHASMFDHCRERSHHRIVVMEALRSEGIREDSSYSLMDLLSSIRIADVSKDRQSGQQLTGIRTPISKEGMKKLAEAQQEGIKRTSQPECYPSTIQGLPNICKHELPMTPVFGDVKFAWSLRPEVINVIRGYWPYFTVTLSSKTT